MTTFPCKFGVGCEIGGVNAHAIRLSQRAICLLSGVNLFRCLDKSTPFHWMLISGMKTPMAP